MTNEIWRWIVGYEGYYKVSDMGRVKSVTRSIKTNNGQIRTYQGKILKPWFSRDHAYVGLQNGKELVHRLVLSAFIGPCPEGQEGRHFPHRDPTNNRLDNLQWGTKEQNQGSDRVAQGTSNRGENCGASKLTTDDVRKIRSSNKSRTALAKEYGVSQPTISEIVHRKTWGHI